MSNKLTVLIEGCAPMLNRQIKVLSDGRKFIVAHYENGKHQEDSDFITDDYQRAYDTAGLYLMPKK